MFLILSEKIVSEINFPLGSEDVLKKLSFKKSNFPEIWSLQKLSFEKINFFVVGKKSCEWCTSP